MSQKQIEKRPSISTLAVQQIALELAEKLPDVQLVEIEPHETWCIEEMPAVGIFYGQEEVTDIQEFNGSANIRMDGDRIVDDSCCSHCYQLQLTFFVEVIAEQCDGAYAVVEQLNYLVKQIVLNSGVEGIYYAGSGNFRNEEDTSNTVYSRSQRFFFQYQYPEDGN